MIAARIRRAACCAVVAGAFAVGAAHAGEPAVRTSLFVSDDADGTSVTKATAGALFGYAGPSSYVGVVAEDVRIRPLDGATWSDQRLYLAFAREGTWAVKGLAGTDGRTVLGDVSAVREGTVRQEYFVERDRLETRLGVQGGGLFQTFVGASFDLPLDTHERQQLNVLVGAQEFTGDNVRTHLRARYSLLVAPDLGFSVQLRARTFWNSQPFDADYYSPRHFTEIMPAAQLRRFYGGWMYAAVAGVGRQSDGERWKQARLVDFTVRSPIRKAGSYFRLNATYSDTPVGNGARYGYRQLSAEWIRPL